MPDGSLVIHNLDFNDMGLYVCVAKNKFGHSLAETFVYPVAVSIFIFVGTLVECLSEADIIQIFKNVNHH